MLSRIGLELASRRAVFVAMKADRGLPDALDQVEHVGALLVAHGVAEDAPEQTDVIAQPGVFQRLHVIGAIGPDFGVGRHGLKGHGATLQKLPSYRQSVQFFCRSAR